MSATDAPPHGSQDKAGQGEAWGYGTHLDQPLGAPSSTDAALDPGDEPPTTDRGEGPEPQPDEKSEEAEAGPANAKDTSDRRSGNKTPTQSRSGEDRNQEPPAGTEDDEKGGAEKDEPPPPPPSKWVFVGVALVLVALLAWGGFARWKRDHAAGEARQDTLDTVPEVRTVEAKNDESPVDLTLPGQTEAFSTASLYARATGYVSERRADIGTRVKKGDLLVHIAAPDLDQQLAQAEAQVGQVKAAEAQAHAQVDQADANVNLAKVTLARTAQLTDRGYETLQNRDNQTANLQSQQANLETAKAGVKVAEANTKAQLATVDRLKALTGFEDVRAPFNGVVTVRNVDVGDLVNADSASASPLFSVAQDDVIRVTVQVPQNNAVGVRNGLGARIEVPQLPGQLFLGTVTRSSVALLSSARTLDTEVDIPNPDGRLRAGLFTYVTVGVPRTKPDVMVPAEALIFNQHGLQVATVQGDAAHLTTVKVDRDFGTTVSIVEGLNGGEKVIVSPPAMLKDGAKVKMKPAEDKRSEDGDQPGASKDSKSDKDGAGQDASGGGKPAADKGKQPG